MVGSEYFTETLPLVVAGNGGSAIVRIHRSSGGAHIVRDIIKTHDGCVTFNAYVNATGDEPIISASSNAYDFEPGIPVGYEIVTVPFEDVLDVQVVPCSAVSPIIYH